MQWDPLVAHQLDGARTVGSIPKVRICRQSIQLLSHRRHLAYKSLGTLAPARHILSVATRDDVNPGKHNVQLQTHIVIGSVRRARDIEFYCVLEP